MAPGGRGGGGWGVGGVLDNGGLLLVYLLVYFSRDYGLLFFVKNK